MRVSLVLLLALGACHAHGDGGPPCSAVAGNFFLIARGELDHAQVDGDIRRAVTDQLPAMRDALAQLCTDGAWSAPARDCMVRAGDHAGLQACEGQLTGDQRAALDDAQRGVHRDTSSP